MGSKLSNSIGARERGFGRKATMIVVVAPLMLCWGCNRRTGNDESKQKEGATVIKKPWLEVLETRTGKKGYEAYAAHFNDLKKRYAGKIDATVTGAGAKEHRLRFESLMREWNPMNSTPAQIKAIAGRPTSETDNGCLTYTFDDGTTVVQWVLAGSYMMQRNGPFTGPDRMRRLQAEVSKGAK